MKVKGLEARPIKQKDGTWKVITKEIETNKAMIIYSKTGTHIYPRGEKQ